MSLWFLSLFICPLIRSCLQKPSTRYVLKSLLLAPGMLLFRQFQRRRGHNERPILAIIKTDFRRILGMDGAGIEIWETTIMSCFFKKICFIIHLVVCLQITISQGTWFRAWFCFFYLLVHHEVLKILEKFSRVLTQLWWVYLSRNQPWVYN